MSLFSGLESLRRGNWKRTTFRKVQDGKRFHFPYNETVLLKKGSGYLQDDKWFSFIDGEAPVISEK